MGHSDVKPTILRKMQRYNANEEKPLLSVRIATKTLLIHTLVAKLLSTWICTWSSGLST